MSIITSSGKMLHLHMGHTSVVKPEKITKTKYEEPKTSSIVLLSLGIFVAIILLMFVGITYTDSMMNQYSSCRDKIIGFEERGIYTSPEQFRLALSFCDSK